MGALIGLIAGLALLVWVLRGGTGRRSPLRGDAGDIEDRAELEAAEREVKDVVVDPSTGDMPGGDWGPGVGKPRPPTLL